MNYVISGEGILVAEGRDYELRKGDFALILPGEKHQFKNPSRKQSLVIICAVPREFE
jgi:quercetin dioxygenase-like cupin family protein